MPPPPPPPGMGGPRGAPPPPGGMPRLGMGGKAPAVKYMPIRWANHKCTPMAMNSQGNFWSDVSTSKIPPIKYDLDTLMKSWYVFMYFLCAV